MAGIRVLLIDDEPELLEVSKRYLEISKGFTIYACDSAQEALDVLTRESFEVIVSDYQMPKMDGLQLLRHLRESGNTTEFILFTGKGREDVAVTALNLGATFYLQKGGDFRAQFAELSNMIRRAAESTRAAQDLRYSESKFRSYIENSPEGIAVVDDRGKYAEVNRAFCAMTGYAEAELIGRSVAFLHPDRSMQENTPTFRRLKQDDSGSFDSPFVRKDGTLRYWHIDAVRLEDGRFIGFHSDITQKKEMLDQVLWRERMLEHMSSYNPLGVLMVDQQNERVILANRRFYQIWGLPQPEEDSTLISIGSLALLARCLEKVKDPEKFHARIRQGMADGGVESSEDEVELNDGRVLRRVFNKVRDAQGNYLGRFYLFEDITERRKKEEILRDQEEIYRTLYEDSGDAIVIMDHGRITAGNRQAIQMFRVEDEESLCRLALADISPERQPDGCTAEQVIDQMLQVLAKEGTALVTWRHQRADGTQFPAMARLTSMKISGRQVEQVIIRDMSELESMSQALEETNAVLRLVFDSVSDAIFLIGTDSRIIDVNQRALEMFGISREEVKELSLAEDLSDHGLVGEGSAAIWRKALAGEPQVFEWRSRRPHDGSLFETEGYIRRVTIRGQPAMLLSARDISGRKKVEAEIRQQATRMSLLYEIISIGSSAPNLESLAELSLDTIMKALDYDAAGLYLVDETGKFADLVANRGIGQEEVRGVRRCPIDAPPYDHIFVHKLPIFTSEYPTLERRSGTHLGVVTVASVPLEGRQGIIGCLNMACRSKRPIDEEERSVLIAAGRELGASVERRRAQKAAEVEHRNLQALFDSEVDMVLVTDLTGNIVEANGRVVKVLGFSRTELIGRNVTMLHEHAFQDAAAHVVTETTAGKRAVFPMKISTRDGKILSVETIVTRGTWDGADCLIATTRDISDRVAAETALRQSEEKYRLLVENAAEAVAVVQDGTIRYVNYRAVEITGYAIEDLLGRSITELVCPEDSDSILKGHLERQAGRGKMHHTLRVLTRDGGIKWLDCKSANIGWEGRPATLNLYSDITERLRSEEALRQANRQLNLMNSITRHDILNSTQVMTGLLELARRGEAEQSMEMKHTLEKLRRHTKLIQNHVEFTRIYHDIGSQAPQWQDLDTMLLRLAVPLGMEYDVSCKGVHVLADPMLEKVFANLIDNTVRHGVRANRVKIHCQPGQMGLDIIYEDDGVGVPADEKEHIFDYGHGRNTGLGLFLAREILSITQMRIRENGSEGKGARFEIHVPKGSYRCGRR
jgi:PAS domain S-box-containing protein